MSVVYNPQSDSVNYPAANEPRVTAGGNAKAIPASGPAGVPDNATYVNAVNDPAQSITANGLAVATPTVPDAGAPPALKDPNYQGE
jgi:hypothetical protein